ncbi:GH25 family lysozyme [Catellatospora methionotrophica]|uniref:GH25 family lysozyme n=1 Tax=Catellatospora methionotrophica TaxID=121620 RepID=UPI0033D016DC
MNLNRTAAARRVVLAAAGLLLSLAALPAGAAPPPDPLGPDGKPITDGWAGAGTPADLAPPAAARALAGAPGGYPVTGIDVSHHQGDIDWDKVADRGAKFVYAKATEGVHYVDASFKDNYSGARGNGILFGAYHFARPDKTNGRTQADYFLDRAQYRNDGRSLPPMLDIEWPYKLGGKLVAPGPCWGKSKNELVRFIRDFTERVRERTGSATMIYTNPNWWNPCTGRNADFGDHYLFVSSYTDKVRGLPAGWDRWTLWQYANHGKLPGDQNVFNGNLADLAALAANPGGPLPRPVVGDWDGNGTMTPGLVSAEGDTWRWRLSNTLDGTPDPALDFTYGDAEKAPLVGDWDGNGTYTPGTVDAEGKRRDFYLVNSFRSGPADIHTGFGGVEDIPVVGDWDGNGTFTPGAVGRDGKLHSWQLTNTFAKPVTEIAFTYGDAGKTPIVGDWDGNRTFTPGTVDMDGDRHDYYLSNVTTGGATQVHVGFGAVFTVPLVGDWNGDKVFTPGAIDASGDAGLVWQLTNSLTGGSAVEITFTYGGTGAAAAPAANPAPPAASPQPSTSPNAPPSPSDAPVAARPSASPSRTPAASPSPSRTPAAVAGPSHGPAGTSGPSHGPAAAPSPTRSAGPAPSASRAGASPNPSAHHPAARTAPRP